MAQEREQRERLAQNKENQSNQDAWIGEKDYNAAGSRDSQPKDVKVDEAKQLKVKVSKEDAHAAKDDQDKRTDKAEVAADKKAAAEDKAEEKAPAKSGTTGVKALHRDAPPTTTTTK